VLGTRNWPPQTLRPNANAIYGFQQGVQTMKVVIFIILGAVILMGLVLATGYFKG